MELKKSVRVNYLFYKMSLAEMILLGVIVSVVFVIYYWAVHQLIIELFYIDFEGPGFFMWILFPFIMLGVAITQKWVYPNLRLRKVEMDSQTLSFYQAKKEYHLKVVDIDKLVVFVDTDEMSDDMTIVKRYTMHMGKTQCMISLDECKGILASEVFHQELTNVLGLNEKEYKLKKVGTVGFNRTYLFK